MSGILTRSGPWLNKVKRTDQSKTSNTGVGQDDVIYFPLVSGKKYAFRSMVQFSQVDGAPDLKFTWRVTGGATRGHLWGQVLRAAAVDSTFVQQDLAAASAFTSLGGANEVFTVMTQGMLVASNSNDFGLRWAQNTSDLNALTCLAGSWIEWRALP